MKIKHLILLTTTAVAASSLSSCSYDDYVITREEQYARDFIKTFGLIAEGHDWTAAQHTDVTVKTQTSIKVKIYADYNGETYIFGNYDVNPGSSTLKFDIPKGATNICLKANDRKIAFTPGQTVDLAANLSRAALGGIEDHLGISGTYNDVTVTIEENEGRAMTLTSITMTEALERLPENPSQVTSWKETNLSKVTDNFSVTASEFYLFPEYWNTSHSKDNIIGIYWYASKDTPGAEEVTVTNPDNSTSTYYVIRIPVLQDPWFLYKYCNVTTQNVQRFTDLNNWDELFDKLCKKFEGKYKKETVDGQTKYYHIFKDKEEDGWLLLNYTCNPEKQSWAESLGCDWNNEVSREVCKLMMNLAVDTNMGYLTIATGDMEEIDYVTNSSENSPANSPTKGDKLFYKSYGIHIKLSEEKTFGFYIQQDDCVMYSQRRLNDAVTIDGETRQPSYVATYVDDDDTDTEGNDKRHLCFEDWHSTLGYNWDLNDMVFRVYGFDKIAKTDPGKPIEPGKVTDEDKTPTPPPTTDDDDDGYKPFRWIVACEDLGGADDYDFNDVVFGVEHVGGEREVYVTALAAGGTLETHLMFNNGTETIEVTGGKKTDVGDAEFGQYSADGSGKTFDEWHKWFGSSSFSNMINTTSFSGVGATVVLVLPKDTEFSMDNTAPHDTSKFGGFSVKVINNDQTITEISAPAVNNSNGVNTENIFPQMFVTTVDYKWPTERTSIYHSHQGDKNTEVGKITLYGSTYIVYENSFHDWVQNYNNGFHSQPPTGNVINHGWKGYKK